MTIRDEAFLGRPISAFVVDAHTHISPYYMNGWYQTPAETDTAAIVRGLDRLGIDCIVTAPHPLIMGMMATANAITEAAVCDFPGRIWGYICICPGEGLAEVKAQLKKYGSHPGFIGMKFLPGYHGSLKQPEYEYAADYADEKAGLILTHTWGGDPPHALIEDLAARHPHLKLLCAHQGGGSADLSRKIAEVIRRQPNLYMEICGSLVNPLSIEDLVDLTGEDRVIFGSDQINLDPRYDFGRVIFSTLPDAVKKKLLAENYLGLLQDSQMGQINRYA